MLPLRAKFKVVRAPTERLWWAQRLALRLATTGGFVVGVTGRQVGKSRLGSHLILRRALRRPKGASLILVPTYKMGLVQAGYLQRLSAPVGATWKAADKYLVCPNGHPIWVRSADRPDAARGLTVDTLWCDEGAFVSEAAWAAALGTLVAAEDPLILVTTTPKGRGTWVHKLWTGNQAKRFFCRSQDSPVTNPELLATLRESMSAMAAAEELDAVFVDDDTAVFRPADLDVLFGDQIQRRGKRWALGVDLAKEVDYTVVIAMNEFGEFWVLGRWRHVDWPDTHRRIIELAKQYEGVLVVDYHQGSGYGGITYDILVRELGPGAVVPVKTGRPGVKAEIVEELIADVEHGRLRTDPGGQHAVELRHEMTFFGRTRKISGGTEVVRYEGPSTEDEHDDLVIALSLANHGRRSLEDRDLPLRGNMSGFGELNLGLPPPTFGGATATETTGGWGRLL